MLPGSPPAAVPHRGGMLVALGVVGLALFPLGAAVWSMANRDLDYMDEGRVDRAGEGLTRVAKVLGVLSVVGACVLFGVSFLGTWLLTKMVGGL